MDLNLKQKDVAARIGADEASVWLWENGRVQPGFRFLPAIFTFLGKDPRPAPSTIGERLVCFRQARGWSQSRLAEEIGVDATTLSRWELGKKKPWGPYVGRIERVISANS